MNDTFFPVAVALLGSVALFFFFDGVKCAREMGLKPPVFRNFALAIFFGYGSWAVMAGRAMDFVVTSGMIIWFVAIIVYLVLRIGFLRGKI